MEENEDQRVVEVERWQDRFADVLELLPRSGGFLTASGGWARDDYPRDETAGVDAEIESTIASMKDYLEAVRSLIRERGYYDALVAARDQTEDAALATWAKTEWATHDQSSDFPKALGDVEAEEGKAAADLEKLQRLLQIRARARKALLADEGARDRNPAPEKIIPIPEAQDTETRP
jgi:hypothetical protein